MNRLCWFTVIIGAPLLMLSILVGCSDSESDKKAEEVKADVVITIGNLTDKTGVSSSAMSIIDQALQDMVDYYNEADVIPGVELKVIDYDDQYSPSRDIPGYESLISRGADFIWTPIPPAAPTLKPRVDQDKYVIFTATANMDQSELQGGYLFSLGITPRFEALTMLNWIAENHESFPTDRPAKIGGAAWRDAYSSEWFEAMKDYARAHPDQYEWVDGFLTEFKFTWEAEIEALKDCDYLYIPIPSYQFIKDYRNSGYADTTFIGNETHTAFMGTIDKGNLWDEMDGMIYIRVTRWYNQEGPIIDLINKILDEKYSPEVAEQLRRDGCGYLAAKQVFLMLDIVRKAVEEAGPENFNSDSLYNAATNWSYELAGKADFNSFDETKRTSQDYYAIYEAREEDKNLFQISDWMYQITEP